MSTPSAASAKAVVEQAELGSPSTDDKAAVQHTQEELPEKTEGRPACFRSTVHEVLFVLTCTMTIAMGAMTGGSVTVSSSFIASDLNMTAAQLTWAASASSLAGGAFLLFFAKIADLFGRKILFVGSLFFYAVFALAAGFSKDPITLDILNGVIGLMSASGVPSAQGMLGMIYDKPSERKNAAFACFSAGNPLGFVAGLLLGGIATTVFSWRAAFWLLAIIYLLFAIMAFFVVPPDTSVKEPLNWEVLKRFDIIGTLCTIGGIGCLSAALSLGSTAPQGWRTGYVLALLIIGLVLIIVFCFWENYFEFPLVPMGIWRDRDFSLCIVILLLGYLAFNSTSFFIALYFQRVWHYSAIMTAVHLLPMAVVGVLVNIVAGLILHRVSNKLLMFIGCLGYTLAYLLFSLNHQSVTYWAFCFPALCLGVVGADFQFNVANMYVMSSLPRDQQSIAGGIFQTVARLCSTIGFGAATALFNSVEQHPSMSTYWDKTTQPYAATFWFATACVALSIGLVPFLTITTQGAKAEIGDEMGLHRVGSGAPK